MNFDNTSSILEPNESIIKTGLHIILTTDEDDLRPVYLSGILTSGVQDQVRDGENRKVYIILNLPMILIIQKHYCINLQRGLE
jgi:hypothetical protein